MTLFDGFILGAYAFGRNLVGIAVRPYETCRRIAREGSAWELVFVAVVLSVYFAFASMVKTAAFRPYLLTKHFVILSLASAVSAFLVAGALWFASVLVGGAGSFKRFLIAWGYTLIPTVLWFLMTSVLYVVLPPPRTERLAGIAFSVLYIVMSTALLLWKIILAYLSVRFVMRLPLWRIVIAFAMAGPFIALYGAATYAMRIFRIPFL